MALLLELGSYTTTMSYNFVRGYSYLSYLEYPILLIQEYVLIYCVLKYNGMLNSRTTIYALLYVGIAGLFLTQTIPPSVLTMLLVSRRMEIRLKDVNNLSLSSIQPLCTPVGATSKIMQLAAILKSKDSSTVSQVTWAISAFTNSSEWGWNET